jgi:hypothetical protein
MHSLPSISISLLPAGDGVGAQYVIEYIQQHAVSAGPLSCNRVHAVRIREKQMERFVPGQWAALNEPLVSYRQPLSEQVLRTYIDLLSTPGGLVVSPFAQSECLARVASAMGRRSVSAHANPLLMLLARARAAPAPVDAIDALYRQVADAPHHAITTRQHTLDLYRSRCPHCGWALSADYFVWGREENRPLAKGYTCPSCEAAGEHPVDAEDLELAAGYQTKSLPYWRVLSRLASRGDAIYPRAQSLLDLYTGRNLYALHHLTSRVEGARLDLAAGRSTDARAAILLDCLERGASLDSPTRARRMARLGAPARFVEHNVWRLFEQACVMARGWARWPAIAHTALRSPLERTTITVSNAAQLSRALPDASVELIISSPPTPGPAFWTLSYMWSAWLLGKSQATSLAHWLKRHSVDWNWYVEVLSMTLSSLGRLLSPEGHLVLAWRCEQTRWIEAVLIAAGQAELSMAGLACQPLTTEDTGDAPDAAEYRIVLAPRRVHAAWVTRARNDAGELELHIRRAGRESALSVLSARGEPTPGPLLHAGAYRRLIDEGLLSPGAVIRQQTSVLHFVERTIWRDVLGKDGIWPLEAPETVAPLDDIPHPDLKPELWWSERVASDGAPLLDRIELCVVDLLSEASSFAPADLYDAIYTRFEGALTPGQEAVTACIASYARQDDAGEWRLRVEDECAGRQTEMRYVQQCVERLGERLRMKAHVGRFGECALRDNDVVWESDAEPPYLLRVVCDTVSAHLEIEAALASHMPQCVLVLPGGRSSLVLFRLRSSAPWREAVERQGWRFVKYRHVRRLMREEVVDRSSLLSIVGLDPIVEHAEVQMPLL